MARNDQTVSCNKSAQYSISNVTQKV